MKKFWCKLEVDGWDDWVEREYHDWFWNPEMVAYEFAEYADRNSGGELTHNNRDGFFIVVVRDIDDNEFRYRTSWEYIIQFNVEEENE